MREGRCQDSNTGKEIISHSQPYWRPLPDLASSIHKKRWIIAKVQQEIAFAVQLNIIFSQTRSSSRHSSLSDPQSQEKLTWEVAREREGACRHPPRQYNVCCSFIERWFLPSLILTFIYNKYLLPRMGFWMMGVLCTGRFICRLSALRWLPTPLTFRNIMKSESAWTFKEELTSENHAAQSEEFLFVIANSSRSYFS